MSFFKSVEHFFSVVVHDLGVAANFLNTHQAQVDKALEAGAGIVGALDPALAPIAKEITMGAEVLYGKVFAAISAAKASAADPLNIELDVATKNQFSALLDSIKNIKGAAAMTPPAGLPQNHAG